MPRVDLDFLRGLYDAHNRPGADFSDVLARDYLDADVEFVELATAPGATTHRGRDAVAMLFRDRFEAGSMRVEDLKLTALDDHTVLAAFRIRMLGKGSGADVSMRLWNLLRLEDARIVRVEEFDDETAALAAAGR